MLIMQDFSLSANTEPLNTGTTSATSAPVPNILWLLSLNVMNLESAIDSWSTPSGRTSRTLVQLTKFDFLSLFIAFV